MTMKIAFQNPHLSIKSFESNDLPNFVLLTGFNGAGKTHFLRSIEGGQIHIFEDNQQLNNKRFFDFSTLIPQDTGAFDANSLDNERINAWNNLNNQIQSLKNNVVTSLRQNFGELVIPDELKNILFGKLDLSLTEEAFLSCFTSDEKVIGRKMFISFQQSLTANNENLKQVMISQGMSANFSKNLEKKEGILLINTTQELYFRNFPINSPADIFQHNLGRIFSFYNKISSENKLKRFKEIEEGGKHGSLTSDEFLERYGPPPWEFVNKVFADSKLPFTISKPDEFIQGGYQPILYKNNVPDAIPFSSLSSGEKILMSFALCLYNISAQETQTNVQKPELILFDEIDATLHPSIAYTVINSVVKNVVQDMGVRVIFATHSPTTIALAPEESIYQLENSNFSHKLKKVSKDEALALLTSELPFLNISHENKRQIFVESHNDATYYNQIFNFLKKKLNPNIFLNFISSGGEKSKEAGNSNQVNRLVNDLRNAGNKSVYGLIDWDKCNQDKPFI
jgi:energy-coupling factor transporter ATP-binding protein EcfA2